MQRCCRFCTGAAEVPESCVSLNVRQYLSFDSFQVLASSSDSGLPTFQVLDVFLRKSPPRLYVHEVSLRMPKASQEDPVLFETQ